MNPPFVPGEPKRKDHCVKCGIPFVKPNGDQHHQCSVARAPRVITKESWEFAREASARNMADGLGLEALLLTRFDLECMIRIP